MNLKIPRILAMLKSKLKETSSKVSTSLNKQTVKNRIIALARMILLSWHSSQQHQSERLQAEVNLWGGLIQALENSQVKVHYRLDQIKAQKLNYQTLILNGWVWHSPASSWKNRAIVPQALMRKSLRLRIGPWCMMKTVVTSSRRSKSPARRAHIVRLKPAEETRVASGLHCWTASWT